MNKKELTILIPWWPCLCFVTFFLHQFIEFFFCSVLIFGIIGMMCVWRTQFVWTLNFISTYKIQLICFYVFLFLSLFCFITFYVDLVLNNQWLVTSFYEQSCVSDMEKGITNHMAIDEIESKGTSYHTTPHCWQIKQNVWAVFLPEAQK